MLADLQAGSYALAVITNGHKDIQRGKLERTGLAGHVDHVLVGGEEIAAGRAEKPNPMIFQRACALCHCVPSEVIKTHQCLAWKAPLIWFGMRFHELYRHGWLAPSFN